MSTLSFLFKLRVAEEIAGGWTLLEKGFQFDTTYQVKPGNLAKAMGSGGLEVLATPAVVAFFENACWQACEKVLPQGETTVGSQVEVRHLRPSKPGATILVKATVEEATEKSVVFRLEALDKEVTVATGTHSRVRILTDRFLARL